jgi:hydroxymethylpyrimidine pyrophosphatase-like HAD family hydrolase/energy-coupling factor transporter ATP-binding protein EcfA2
MRYLALACDYDGTLANRGRVDAATLAGLERLAGTGRKLILVTGRELEELLTICPHLDFFEYVVAENGALLYRPATRESKLIGAAPPPTFVEELRRRGITPLSVGHSIVATWHPHETAVLETIRDLGLELQVIFNKNAVMVLPSGVNKSTGLTAVLKELRLSAHEVVGIGDAENDHAFLGMCECSAAVANALPAIKAEADLVTSADHGAGVVELIDRIISDDLASLEDRLTRHHLLFGHRLDGAETRIAPHGQNILIAGPSGSGKSTAATSLIERLRDHRYQFCIVDPEGDYDALPYAVVLGNSQHGPTVEEVLHVLENPEENVVASLVGLPLADRPPFFLALLPRLQEMRGLTGRPHWLVIDETHHLLPASWEPATLAVPQALKSALFITVHPDQVAPVALSSIDVLLAVGREPETTLQLFGDALKEPAPWKPLPALSAGEVLVWERRTPKAPYQIRLVPSRTERLRHTRKYAEGELPPDFSFYFRGPDNRLNLRAQNLILFLQLADGVDDATWNHHLRQGDYSRWFRERIKDENLAAEAVEVETNPEMSPARSRAAIKEAVERHYTLPATTALPMPGTAAEPVLNDDEKSGIQKANPKST